MGFPIRKSTDQRVFAPPRSLSQRITSFIACACQGIHQLPLRHLIVLIANAHRANTKGLSRPGAISKRLSPSHDPSRLLDAIGTKRPASRDRFEGAVRQTHHMREIERLTATNQCFHWSSNKSSLYDVKQNRQRARKPRRKPCWRMIALSTLSTPGNGGAGRDRTDDILLAKQALSQLSYGP